MSTKESGEPTLPAKILAESAELSSLVPYVGPLIEYALGKVPAVRNVRAARMLNDLLDRLRLDASGLIAVLEEDVRFVDLVAEATEAATRSRLDRKIELLAQIAAEGIGSREVIEIDSAHLRLKTVDALEEIHLVVLGVLASSTKPQMSTDELRARFVDERALDAVLSTLVRHGLFGMRDALVGFPGPVYHLTDYGRYILELFGVQNDGGQGGPE